MKKTQIDFYIFRICLDPRLLPIWFPSFHVQMHTKKQDCQMRACGIHIKAVRPPLRLCLSYAVLNLSTSSFMVLWLKNSYTLKHGTHKIYNIQWKINFIECPTNLSSKPSFAYPYRYTGIKQEILAWKLHSTLANSICSKIDQPASSI